MEPGSLCDKVIKFEQDRRLVLLEYPGIVKNLDKMMQTIGGMKNLRQAYRIPNKRIDLRFRPNDPCCHPVCGDRTSATSLLLRVRKYRRKKAASDASPDEFRFIPEIVGIINNAFTFNVLCDFQYLPLSNNAQNDKLINMVPSLQIKDLSGEKFTNDVPLFLPPPTFSRFDQPQDVLFRKPFNFKMRRAVAPDQITIARPKRSHYAVYLKYEEDWTPETPLEFAVENVKKATNVEFILAETKRLFEQRPIWTKNALVCILKTTHERLKNILPVVAYYFITGPWRSLWVRFGYDPRKTPDSARYQLLNFRVRKGLHNPDIPIRPKRSTLNYRLPNLKPRSKGSKNAVNSLESQKLLTNERDRSHQDCVYLFKPGVLPAYRQMFYQVCDIKLPEVEEILKQHFENPGPSKCDLKSGWLQEESFSTVRDLLTRNIYETISSQSQIKMTSSHELMKKWRKRRAKANLSAEERRSATPSEMVDSFHRWGMRSGSSSDDEDCDDDNMYEEFEDGDIAFSFPEEEEEENGESTSAVIDASGNLGEITLEMEGGDEVEDADDLLEDFNAFAAEIDDIDELDTVSDLD